MVWGVEGLERSVTNVLPAQAMAEGAGARVLRVFPNNHLRVVDPFVMLDEFFVEPPAGFPEHPHRGFEIITYMLEGAFRHQDSLGNDRTIHAGGIQKITAGRGLYHSEMPGTPGMNHGLQLWVNLPQRLKQIDPEYQEVAAGKIPEVTGPGYRVRTIAGNGAPTRLQTPVLYQDITLDPAATWQAEGPADFAGFLYVLQGKGKFGAGRTRGEPGQILLLGQGSTVAAQADEAAPLRFVLLLGRPHGEPIRLRGPFVD